MAGNVWSFCNTTEIFFGKGCLKEIGKLAKQHAVTDTVMLVSYSGRPLAAILDEAGDAIRKEGLKVVEFDGVVPNPTLAKAEEGIGLARKENVGLLIGVGGGSACDTAKAIALGCRYEGNLWDLYIGEGEMGEVLPIGAVMTLAGTGSETSIYTVLTNEEIPLKLGFGAPQTRPAFACLDPELTYTVPPYQTACGSCDMFVHILDAYLGRSEDMDMTYAMAEAVMRTIIEFAPKVLENPTDYRARAQMMQAGTLAMGRFGTMGLDANLGNHTLAEDLGAVYNVTHGAVLAALTPAWLRYVKKEKFALLLRYAVNVWHLNPDAADPDRTVEEAISKTKAFFKSLGLPVTLHEMGIDFEKDGRMLADRITGQGDWGDAYMLVTPDEAYEIYRMCK